MMVAATVIVATAVVVTAAVVVSAPMIVSASVVAAVAPAVPSVASAPAQAGAIGVSAPIPAGALPAVVVPAVVAAVEDELSLFERQQLIRRRRDECAPRYPRLETSPRETLRRLAPTPGQEQVFETSATFLVAAKRREAA